ncbi:hypothetical protein JXD38_03360, partial [candidate division WOR-3 bacterium]|nr:hypothetical protein [candidate division WOR-3 bacterium]
MALLIAGIGGYRCWAQSSPIAIAAVRDLPEWMAAPVVQANLPVVLDGSRSRASRRSGRLQYAWAQVSGPSVLKWSDPHSARPEISGMLFGEYTVRLTVTDSRKLTAATELVFGAVETDARGLIRNEDPNIALVFGPLTPLGTSPWPYLDERHQAFADYFGNKLLVDPDLQEEWNDELAGSIRVDNGSPNVLGEGTRFQTDFCGGEGNTRPTGARLVVWYPLPDGG